MSRIPPPVMAELEARSDDACEACHWPAGVRVVHHRRAYGMGGREADDPRQNVPANLLYVHPDCHGRIHANPARSEDHGYIVWDPTDPADVSVIPDRGVRWW